MDKHNKCGSGCGSTSKGNEKPKAETGTKKPETHEKQKK